MHYTQAKTQTDKNDALVGVFCAVWHRQRNKLELLQSHYRNLRQQSLQVRIIYIFDNGDTPPDWLDADCYVFSEPLSIYEAWSAAVAFNTAFYVMNLNLDDRLAVNAVELLVGTACASSAALVGGEWLVCFDEEHLDQPFKAPLLLATEFVPDWPPRPHQCPTCAWAAARASAAPLARHHCGAPMSLANTTQAISGTAPPSNPWATRCFGRSSNTTSCAPRACRC